jgi:hypothetical protein
MLAKMDSVEKAANAIQCGEEANDKFADLSVVELCPKQWGRQQPPPIGHRPLWSMSIQMFGAQNSKSLPPMEQICRPHWPKFSTKPPFCIYNHGK